MLMRAYSQEIPSSQHPVQEDTRPQQLDDLDSCLLPSAFDTPIGIPLRRRTSVISLGAFFWL